MRHQFDFNYDSERNTQLSPRGLPPNAMNSYRYLRLEWTEQTEKPEKLEYILRYNTTRRGFWMSAAPHKRKYPPSINRRLF